MYDAGRPTFRLGSKPEAEARMWAVEGFAGGIQPWWHHIGSVHEDRRQYATAESLFRWHEQNERYLVDREPIATVGLLWSQRSVDFHGKDDPESRSLAPYQGFADALIRARIPYLPVHADHVARDAAGLDVIVVPNVGVLTDAQCDALRAFAAGGGGRGAHERADHDVRLGDAAAGSPVGGPRGPQRLLDGRGVVALPNR